MKNRAKCKLCKKTIESFHDTDFVLCDCNEISVSGGNAMFCSAKSWNNFIRVDENNNEIIPKIVDKWPEPSEEEYFLNKVLTPDNNDISSPKPDREALLKELDYMIENIEKLPEHALILPITHYDFVSSLILLSSILKTT